MLRSLRLLSIEDNDADFVLLRREIERCGYPIEAYRRVDTISGLDEALTDGGWNVCICDFSLPTFHALDALGMIRERGVDLPTIVVSGSVDDQVAAAVFRAGARDLISKNRLARLGPAIARELEEATIRRERAKAIENLRQSEERFRLFTQHLPACVWITDRDGRYVYVNEPWLTLVGRDAWNVIGNAPPAVFESDTVVPFSVRSQVANREGEAVSFHSTVGAADGTKRDFNVMTFPLGGTTSQHASIAIDVTERRRAEDALRASEERFRSVADAAGDAMVTFDESGIVVFVNVAAERMLGRRSSEICGRLLDGFLANESKTTHRERFARMLELPLRGPAPYVTEVRLESATGETVPTEMSVGSWVSGGQRFLTGIFRDLRQRKELEDQLRQAQKMEAVGQLAGGVAHDFNNILSVIDGLSEMIADHLGPSSDVTGDLEEIRRAVDRGATLVRQLLAFSRKQVVSPTTHNLNEVVGDVVKMLRRAIGASITLHLDLDPDLESIRADRGQMGQVLMNLALNARDAMPRGGNLFISTSNDDGASIAGLLEGGADPDGYVLLRVNDDGTGMDEATLTRIFEPFFTTKGVGAGSGLGLSTVYGIVRQSKGHIHVDSEPGRGTRFEIRFPARRESGRMSTTSQEVYSPIGRGETVLVVEEDRGDRATTVQMLRKHGYSSFEIDNADDAARLGATQDLPMLAVVCPYGPRGSTGPKLRERLRATGFRAPFVYLVDDKDPEPGVASLGVDVTYVRRPFTNHTLLSAIRRVLDAVKEKSA